MRNINISQQEIDNFLTTEEGEEMTQPEYRVIQALLTTSRGEAATEIAAKEATSIRYWKNRVRYRLRRGRGRY